MQNKDAKSALLKQIQGGLIASCQAMYKESPINSPEILSAMAVATYRGGACAIRANRPENIKAIRKAVPVPIIGLFKERLPGYDIHITPTYEHARLVAEAGSDIIAIDGTARPHPGELDMRTFIKKIQEDLGKLVMLDISTYEEGVEAEKLGADLIATTMAESTTCSCLIDGPDLELVKRLSATCKIPVIAEGRFEHPADVKRAIEYGAFAVVIGRAITDPERITARYVKAMQ
ncbi:MAG: N-acetylmannosamine-6-phosphate 2-epimerase [Firmicutes bacterium]|nr:N-acetylmannosamine-6-phosphate 2-epimerase [Bacillota bacterium]